MGGGGGSGRKKEREWENHTYPFPLSLLALSPPHEINAEMSKILQQLQTINLVVKCSYVFLIRQTSEFLGGDSVTQCNMKYSMKSLLLLSIYFLHGIEK